MTQLSYVHGASETSFIGDTIGVHFDRIVERFAERDALIVRHQHIRWTYRELKEWVDGFAAGLLALGLNRGDAGSDATGLPAGTYHELISDTMVTAPLTLAPRSAVVLVRP